MGAPDRLGGPSGHPEAPRLGKIAQAREQSAQNEEKKINVSPPSATLPAWRAIIYALLNLAAPNFSRTVRTNRFREAGSALQMGG
jgi:hypothetical protein